MLGLANSSATTDEYSHSLKDDLLIHLSTYNNNNFPTYKYSTFTFNDYALSLELNECRIRCIRL